MKFNDALIGAVLLALSVAIMVAALGYPHIPGQNVGPGAFPGLLAVLLGACSVMLIARGLRERAGGRWITPGAWLRSPGPLRNFLVTVGSLLFYIFASEPLGFIPSGVIVLSAMMWTLGVRRRWILPIALFVTLLIHTVFYKGLRVPLPWGVLQPWLW
jgi:putative tricarboxylic transport membrane protein